jgi:spore coat protein U-like protein
MGATRAGLALWLLAAACAADAAPQCIVAAAGELSFGQVVALASSPDVTSDTGSSFWVNCNAEVASPPTLYSDSARVMSSGGASLPFTLSLGSPSGTQLPATAPGAGLGIARNGTNQSVTLYGKIRSADFRALPAGRYSTSITVTLEY